MQLHTVILKIIANFKMTSFIG